MYKQSTTLARGIVIGTIAGAAVAVVGTQYAMNNKKTLRKSAAKAMNAVGNIVENMDSVFKN